MSLHVCRGKLFILILSAIFCVLPGVNSELKTCDDCGCGIPNPKDTASQIVGGVNSSPYYFPWIVRIFHDYGQGYKHWCGGSVINKDYILTAAHCFHGRDHSKFYFTLGNYEQNLGTGTRVVRKPSVVTIHKDYSKDVAYNNDLALIKLNKPVTLSQTIRPICIPEAGADHTGILATVIGWGRLWEGGPLPDRLQEVQVNIKSQDECQNRTSYYPERLNDNMICAGEGGLDSCQGDSGGPLFIPKATNKYEIAGVVSWGIGCARPNYPGIYVKVPNFLDWLGEHLEGCACTN